MGRSMDKKMSLLMFLLIGLITLISYSVFSAAPTGPESITNISTERRVNFTSSPFSISAGFGNITKMFVNVTKLTSFWSGFYGNISGRITLDDLNNFTFYDWASVNLSVKGNVFAANETVSNWAQVACVNLTGNGTGHSGGTLWLNETILESTYGMTDTTSEGFGETFASRNRIVIDALTITDCPATYAYTNDSQQSLRWNQTLLSVNNTHTLIFASSIEDNQVGYNNQSVDFQILVADKNTAGPTNYLFYIELV